MLAASRDYNDPLIANALPTLPNIYPLINFITLDVVIYTKLTDDKIEEHEFTFRLMTRQYNSPIDLDKLNNEIKKALSFILRVFVLLKYHVKVFKYNI